jgi:hypothetical protein
MNFIRFKRWIGLNQIDWKLTRATVHPGPKSSQPKLETKEQSSMATGRRCRPISDEPEAEHVGEVGRWFEGSERRGAHRRLMSTATGGLVKGVGGEDVNQRSPGSSRWSGGCGAMVGSSRWWLLVQGTVRAAHPCGGTRRQMKSKAAGSVGPVFGPAARGWGRAWSRRRRHTSAVAALDRWPPTTALSGQGDRRWQSDGEVAAVRWRGEESERRLDLDDGLTEE